jgi:hypothetical protein
MIKILWNVEETMAARCKHFFNMMGDLQALGRLLKLILLTVVAGDNAIVWLRCVLKFSTTFVSYNGVFDTMASSRSLTQRWCHETGSWKYQSIRSHMQYFSIQIMGLMRSYLKINLRKRKSRMTIVWNRMLGV